MKLTIERANLLAVLATCKAAVSTRTTIPALACVHISAKAGALTVTATDLDVWALDTTQAYVDAPGEICINLSDLHDLVRRLPDGAEIEMEQDGPSVLRVRSGRTKASIGLVEVDLFPTLPAEIYPHRFEIEIGPLQEMIGKTSHAICSDETRFALCGIYLHVAGGEEGEAIASGAFNGHILSLVRRPLPSGAEGMPGIIVPTKAINVVSPILSKRADKNRTEPVELAVSESKIEITIGTFRLVSKLIEGVFPDYAKHWPPEPTSFAKVPRRQLGASADRAVALTDIKGNAVTLAFGETYEDGLTLTSSASLSSIEDHLTALIEGEPQPISVNGKYLSDALANFTSDDVTLAMLEPKDPIEIFGDSDPGHRVLIQSMRA